MDQDGLEQAQERFARMSIAAAVVASEAPLEEREGAWLDVVNIFGTIYSKLEQAAKATPEATKWFAKRRAERKSDPLLQYMHQARNAGEHSIVRSAGKAEFAVQGTVTGSGGMLGLAFDSAGRPYGVSDGMGDVKVFEQEILLHAARNRGVNYRPPQEHRGQKIEAHTAKDIAPLVVAYADEMLSEARGLCPPIED